MEYENQSTSDKVIQAVAVYTDTGPLELPPLYDTIDAHALNTLIGKMREGETSFEYAGTTVTIDSSEVIEINGHVTASELIERG